MPARMAHAVVCCLAVGGALAVAAAPSSYADGSTTIVSSQSAPGDPGLFEVHVVSDSGVAAAGVKVNGGDPNPMHLVDGTVNDGTWESDRLNLLLGNQYQFAATVTDGDGAVVSGPTVYVSYRVTGHGVGVSFDRATLDFDHPVTTLSGTVVAIDPRTGDESPAAGWSLHSMATGWATFPRDLTTASDGSFSEVYSPVSPASFPDGTSQTLQLFATPPGGTGGGSPDLVGTQGLTFGVDPVRFTMDPPPGPQAAGANYAVSGLVEHQVAGVWKALAGVPLRASGSGVDTADVTSDDAGRFTVHGVFPGGGALPVQVQLDTAAMDFEVFLQHPSATVSVPAWRTTQLSESAFDLDASADLRVAGQVSAGGDVPGQDARPLQLERSADGVSGWSTVSTFSSSGTDGTYDATVHVTHPAGYWRVRYLGGADDLAVAGPVHQVTTRETRFTGMNASPEPVKKGHDVTVDGTLEQLASARWAAFTGQRVDVWFRAKGSTTYHRLGHATTSKTGHFSTKLTATTSGYWQVRWTAPTGAVTHLDAASRADYVKVR